MSGANKKQYSLYKHYPDLFDHHLRLGYNFLSFSKRQYAVVNMLFEDYDWERP